MAGLRGCKGYDTILHVMNGQCIWETNTRDAASTERLGEYIGKKLQGGEVVELVSDIGGGKTTFTRGLVRGTGSKDHVTSPTFTISQEYCTDRFIVYHFDFYRLPEAGIMADELAEVVGKPESVVIIEWGDIVRQILPEDKLSITISAASENERKLVLSYPSIFRYLIPDEQK